MDIELLLNSNDENSKYNESVFMNLLNIHLAKNGVCIKKLPRFRGVNLYQLFKTVCEKGGFEFISRYNRNRSWADIWRKLGNFHPHITDVSFHLKKYYKVLLLSFENAVRLDVNLRTQLEMIDISVSSLKGISEGASSKDILGQDVSGRDISFTNESHRVFCNGSNTLFLRTLISKEDADILLGLNSNDIFSEARPKDM